MATILVVDDRKTNRDFLVSLLGYGGHRLLEAADGEEALAQVSHEKVDLLITDILMPRMDGVELVSEIRKSEGPNHLPVIFYTATYRVEEARMLAARWLATHVLPKPSEPEQILKIVLLALGDKAGVLPPWTGHPAADPEPEPSRLLTERVARCFDDIESEAAAHLHPGSASPAAGLETGPHLGRTWSELHRNALRVAALNELSLEFAAQSDPHLLLEMFCRVARDLATAKYAGIGIVDPGGDGFADFVSIGLSEPAQAAMRRGGPRMGVLGRLLSTPRTLRFRDLEHGPRDIGLPPDHPPFTSFMALPIVASGPAVGWLYLAGRMGRDEFADDDQEIAMTVAAQAAVSHERSSAMAELKRQADDLEREVEERRRAEQHLKLQFEIASHLSRDWESDEEAAQWLLERICQGMEWDAGAIWVPDQELEAFHASAFWCRPGVEIGNMPERMGEVLPISGQDVPARAAAQKTPLWIEDLDVEPGSLQKELIDSAGIRSSCAFPVLVAGRLVAILQLFAVAGKKKSPEAVEVIASLSSQMGYFIDRFRTRHEIEERARLAALSAEIAMALNDARQLPEILQSCCTALVGHLDAAFARIWTLNRKDNVLELQASAGLYTHLDGPHSRVPVGRFKIGRIAERRQAHVTNNVQADPLVSDQNWAAREGMVAFAGHPLIVEDHLLGVMALFARHPLGIYALKALRVVANNIALGIQRRQSEEERILLEAQLRQAQKMEAIGSLAGGVAHDFNNLLTVILGYCQMLERSMPPEDSRGHEVEQIRKAGERAAALTRQLLVFSRKEVVHPRVVNLGESIRDLTKMLKRLIGEDVILDLDIAGDVGSVRLDPIQVEQIVMNLAVNARDAMPAGGDLLIQLKNVTVHEPLRDIGVKPGQYVLLTVSDTGIGMDDAMRSRIFEPFFTTKEAGKGTGLGLSTVYGIVHQNNGRLVVWSQPEKGTRFDIYLPRVENETPRSRASRELPQLSCAILLIEDDVSVRTMTRRILQQAGCRLFEAGDGMEALEKLQTHADSIDLVMTDVVLPGMNGRELADKMRENHPFLPVLFVSGYTDDAVIHRGVLPDGIDFLHKPFTGDRLIQKIGELLAKSKWRHGDDPDS